MSKKTVTQSADQATRDAHKLVRQLEDFETYTQSAIALLQLFAEKAPAGFPSDDQDVITMVALAEAAVKVLRGACEDNTVSSYTTAGEKVYALLGVIEENMGHASEETAALLFGLTWAIEDFLRGKGLLIAKPSGDAPLESPAALAAGDADREPEPPEEPKFTDPQEAELNDVLWRVDSYIDATEHINLGNKQPLNFKHKHVMGHFYDAQHALWAHQGVKAATVHLCSLHARLMELQDLLDEYDAWGPLVAECLQLLEPYVKGLGHMVKDAPERRETARQAATFIARLADYFATATHPGTAGDLAAISAAACVVMSCEDCMETETSLHQRLQRAMLKASVILLEQPPAAAGWVEDSGERAVRKSDLRKYLDAVPA
jgi:hypothetical protein